MKDATLKRMHVVSSDREKRAQKILRQETDWNGKFPIPIKWFGGAQMSDLSRVNIVHTSGDDKCIWVKDAVSAVILFLAGHDLETSPEVLAKRVTFKG